MPKRVLFSILIVGLPGLLLVQSCVSSAVQREGVLPSSPSSSPPLPAPKNAVQKNHTTAQVGEASWYGPGFHGEETSSGEIYDQHKLTAAHPTLPEGTKVKVTNLENNESTTVRVNDRGPYVEGRIIDMSRKAAKELDMLEEGTAKVKVEVLSKPKEAQAEDSAGSKTQP